MRSADFADCYPAFGGDADWDFDFRLAPDDDSVRLARPVLVLDSHYLVEHFYFRLREDAGLVSCAECAQSASSLWPVVTEPD